MVAKVWREEGEPLVSWCLVPFSRALIICIDRASFEAKTCLNSAATGSSAFFSLYGTAAGTLSHPFAWDRRMQTTGDWFTRAWFLPRSRYHRRRSLRAVWRPVPSSIATAPRFRLSGCRKHFRRKTSAERAAASTHGIRLSNVLHATCIVFRNIRPFLLQKRVFPDTLFRSTRASRPPFWFHSAPINLGI